MVSRLQARKLGDRQGHIYVTRAATLSYQKLTGAAFETARRTLTERLVHATPDPERQGCYLLPIRGDARLCVRVLVSAEGPLLVIPKLERYDGALTGANHAGYTSTSPS